MHKFGRREILYLTLRTFFIRLFYNYSNLFGEGLCYCILPFFGKDTSCSGNDILKKHLGFFNTNEYMSGYALGIIINSEMKSGGTETEKIKTVLSSALGSIGDNLVYKLILPVLVLTALNAASLNGFKMNALFISVIIFELAAFNIFNIMIRYNGLRKGIEKGTDSLKYFKSNSYKTAVLTLRRCKVFLSAALVLNLMIRVNILLFF